MSQCIRDSSDVCFMLFTVAIVQSCAFGVINDTKAAFSVVFTTFYPYSVFCVGSMGGLHLE